MLRVITTIVGLAAASAAVAVDKPVYDAAYEFERDSLPDPSRAAVSNDIFETRETHVVGDYRCFYLSGKLHASEDPGRYPDTYLFMFDKDDNVVCEDDNSSTKGNGKASACYEVAPIPNGDDGGATVRIGVTGRPDGLDNMFNGLFFNAPHEQLGEATVCVRYYGAGDDARGTGGPVGGPDGSVLLDTDTYVCTFVTGAEAFRINYVVPEGTTKVDVEIDNTTETFPLCDDVDFYELQNLEAACDYVVTVIGGTDENCERSCAILGWYDKNGGLVSVATDPAHSDDNRNGDAGQGAQLSLISDANGRIRLAVSGYGDENFDGLLDEAQSRSVGTPGYTPPAVHGCCTCYTLKVEWNKHLDVDPCETDGGPEQLQLANGDLNLDGGVDVIDLAIMLNNWGWIAP